MNFLLIDIEEILNRAIITNYTSLFLINYI